MKSRTKRMITYSILAGLTIGGIAMIPNKQERLLNSVSREVKQSVFKAESLIDNVEINFNHELEEIILTVEINPIEADEIKGTESKDLGLYESKELSTHALRSLNKALKDKTGKTLEGINTTVKVVSNQGRIYNYLMLENNELREIK